MVARSYRGLSVNDARSQQNATGTEAFVGDNRVTMANSSFIMETLQDILTTKAYNYTNDTTHDTNDTTSAYDFITEAPEQGLSAMEKWFLITACLIGACFVLMIINALLHYKDTVMSELRKRDIGQKRVRRDGMGSESDERKEYQTHVFYHPFTNNRNDARSDSYANHL